jgi:hypothetical protein
MGRFRASPGLSLGENGLELGLFLAGNGVEGTMKAKQVFLSLAVILAIAAASPQPLAAEAGLAPWGAKAAAADADRSVDEMLRYAIEDEYLARAEYAAIIKKYGSFNPFANIIRAEETHIAWLKDAYKGAGLAVPADGSASRAVIPETQKAAFQAGVEAEVDNIAMYDSFLASAVMAKGENSNLKALFTRLRDASENHLAAFKNGLARY